MKRHSRRKQCGNQRPWRIQPVTKSLVEMHGGYLDLQSELGVGTTVTVRFPAERIVHSPRYKMAVGAAEKKAG